MCECLPSTSVLGWSDTCICTRSGIPASPFGTGGTKGIPGIINRHFSQQPIHTETCKGRLEVKSTTLLNKREHGSRGALFCSEEGGISHRSAWPERFLYMRCAPLGCLANRKTSVRYKFSLAKGHFLSLKEKQIPLSVLWALSDMNGLTAKKKHLFLLLLLPAILFDPRRGGNIPLLRNLTFSEICVSAWGHVLHLQSNSVVV